MRHPIRRTVGIVIVGALAVVAGVAPVAAQSVKITLWHAMGGARYDAITKEIAAGFNKAHPNYVLEPLYTGKYGETVTKAIAAVRAGDPPHIVQVFEVGTQTMLDSGAIIPVTELVKGGIDFGDYIEPILNYYTVGGKLASMPFNSSTAIIYYNKDVFRKAGLDPENPPRTYKDIEDMGAKIVASGAARAAITFGWPSWMLEQAHAMHDQPYADNDNGRRGRATRVTFNAPFGVHVLSRWKRWADAKLLAYGGREYAPNKAFLSGEVAMLMQSTSQVTTIEKAAKFPVGTGFLPRLEGQPAGKSVIGGASFWVLKGQGRSPQELDAIVQFFKFVAQPNETAKWHMSTGYFPATKTAVELLRKHGQALARPLGVPDNPDAPVAGLAARLPDFVATVPFHPALRQPRGAEGLLNRHLHGVELVVAGHLLGQGPVSRVFEDEEVADQGKEPTSLEDPLEGDLELGELGIGQGTFESRPSHGNRFFTDSRQE